MKITYDNGFGPRETYDYNSVSALITAFIHAYGEESAKRIKIISVEDISRPADPRADYFARYGTEMELK